MTLAKQLILLQGFHIAPKICRTISPTRIWCYSAKPWVVNTSDLTFFPRSSLPTLVSSRQNHSKNGSQRCWQTDLGCRGNTDDRPFSNHRNNVRHQCRGMGNHSKKGQSPMVTIWGGEGDFSRRFNSRVPFSWGHLASGTILILISETMVREDRWRQGDPSIQSTPVASGISLLMQKLSSRGSQDIVRGLGDYHEANSVDRPFLLRSSFQAPASW